MRLLGGRKEAIDYEHETACQECFDAAIAHLVCGLRTGEPFETNPADNLDTLRLVEDADERAR
jgi:hypothetical protein